MSNEDLKCTYCNKSYSTKYTRSRHEEKCKYILEIQQLKERINILEKENIELKNKEKIDINYNYVNEYFKEDKQIDENDSFDFSSFSSGFNTPIETNNDLKEEQNNKYKNKTFNEFIDKYIYHIKNFDQIEKNKENKYNLYKLQKLKQINKK